MQIEALEQDKWQAEAALAQREQELAALKNITARLPRLDTSPLAEAERSLLVDLRSAYDALQTRLTPLEQEMRAEGQRLKMATARGLVREYGEKLIEWGDALHAARTIHHG